MIDSKEKLTITVAKSIYEARNGKGVKSWHHIDNSHKSPYIDDAKAAIMTIFDALKEPTEEMNDEWEFGAHSYTSKEVWQAMLFASPLAPEENK